MKDLIPFPYEKNDFLSTTGQTLQFPHDLKKSVVSTYTNSTDQVTKTDILLHIDSIVTELRRIAEQNQNSADISNMIALGGGASAGLTLGSAATIISANVISLTSVLLAAVPFASLALGLGIYGLWKKYRYKQFATNASAKARNYEILCRELRERK